jgi:hypothetical protein
MERTQIYLTPELKKLFKGFAHEDDTNMSEVLRNAAEAYAARRLQDKKQRKEKVHKALQAFVGMWEDRDPKDFEWMLDRRDRVKEKWGIKE